ncbi:PHP domain-containing protein [Nakamurella silvestris]|nr:PHP domain-containing protein [Nakamurella silvestris]
MRIDLHTHSSCSDGTDTPAALVAAAAAAGLDVVGLTDHDTTAGWAEAAQTLPEGLGLIRGSEFSTQLARAEGGTMSVHLLGYLFDPADPAIMAEQARLVAERRGRGLAIVAKMNADGVPITPERVLAIADGAPVGRPHIGRALVEAGLVGSVTEAFAGYLAGRGKYYVHKQDTDLDAAVSMISAAGGVSVLAHPWSRGARSVLTPERIAQLKERGLSGIEVRHPDQDEDTRAELLGVAADLDLIVTGSSDYHGHNKTLELGQERTSAESLARIIETSSGVVEPIGVQW